MRLVRTDSPAGTATLTHTAPELPAIIGYNYIFIPSIHSRGLRIPREAVITLLLVFWGVFFVTILLKSAPAYLHTLCRILQSEPVWPSGKDYK